MKLLHITSVIIRIQMIWRSPTSVQSVRLLSRRGIPWKKHISVVHEKEKPHFCNECGKSFGFANNLKSHIQSVHENKLMFECTQCDEKFKTKYSLKLHTSIVHEGIKPAWKCTYCDNQSNQSDPLLLMRTKSSCWRWLHIGSSHSSNAFGPHHWEVHNSLFAWRKS